MRINHLFIKSVFIGIIFQLLGNSSCGNALTKTVEEQISESAVFFFQPFHCFGTELFRYVKPAELSAFGVQVKVSKLDVLNLNLLSLLLSILFAFLIGAGILAVSGFHPLEASGAMLSGAFDSAHLFSEEQVKDVLEDGWEDGCYEFENNQHIYSIALSSDGNYITDFATDDRGKSFSVSYPDGEYSDNGFEAACKELAEKANAYLCPYVR